MTKPEAKRAKRMIRQLKYLLITGFLILPKAHASDNQLHLNYGLLYGSYSGPVTGKFVVPTSLDVSYEWFSSNQGSFFIRATFAEDLVAVTPYYIYAGVGMNHYFLSKGMTTDLTDKDTTIIAVPKWRYYFGWDAGMAQVTVKTLGPILSVVSTTLDMGAHVGTIYQIDRKIGIEALLGTSVGYGFSAVAVTGFTGRFFIGATYFF
jgi:hypothetical protein